MTPERLREVLAEEWDKVELNGTAVRDKWGTLRASDAALAAMSRIALIARDEALDEAASATCDLCQEGRELVVHETMDPRHEWTDADGRYYLGGCLATAIRRLRTQPEETPNPGMK